MGTSPTVAGHSGVDSDHIVRRFLAALLLCAVRDASTTDPATALGAREWLEDVGTVLAEALGLSPDRVHTWLEGLEEGEQVGQQIACVLEEQGRQRIWLAERLGVSPGHLTRLLQGERPWTEELLERAAELLGVRFEDLRRG